MAKKAKRAAVRKAPESSLDRMRRETKLRLGREIRLEKQIAALSRQLERLSARRNVELVQLANFLIDRFSARRPLERDEHQDEQRLELAETL